MVIGLYAGDQGCFKIQALDLNGDVLPLTGGTMKFKFKMGAAAAQTRDATITDGPNGKAEYWMPAGDLVAGDLQWNWQFIDAGAHPATGPFPRRRATVVSQLT